VYGVAMCLERSSRICISLCGRTNWRICFRNKFHSPLLPALRALGRDYPMARHGRLTLPPLRRMGFVAWIYCWVIRNFMGSCRGLVRVSGPCTSVCCEGGHMVHSTALLFLFLLLCFYFTRVRFRILFSLFFSFSHLFGLLVHVFLSSSRLSLLSLVHTHGSPDSFALLALPGVHVSALLLSFTSFPFFSHSAGSSFCSVEHFFFLLVSSRLVSSLSSLPLSLYFVLAFFLPVMLRYVIIAIVSICLSALFVFCLFVFTYDQLHYHGSTTQTSTPLFTARYHVCYCFCVWNSYR
jgi:hypothetical protein